MPMKMWENMGIGAGDVFMAHSFIKDPRSSDCGGAPAAPWSDKPSALPRPCARDRVNYCARRIARHVSTRRHSAATAQGSSMPLPAIVPSQTALLVMHYQTDILALFPSAAPALLAHTRQLCDAARGKGVAVYFAQIHFSAGYPEVSPRNKNGQGMKQLGLFINDQVSPELGRRADEPVIVAHWASVLLGN